MRRVIQLMLVSAALTLPYGAEADRAQPSTFVATRALIVSVDGLRPDLLDQADVPSLRRLMAGGAWSLRARTIDPPYTVPAHVSMLTGVVPETHGVTWNSHIEEAYPQVPTLLELAREAGRTTALVVGKTKLIVLTKPGTLTWSHLGHEDHERDADIAEEAATIIRHHRPEVMFVHLGDVDMIGHERGWGSAEQLRAIEEADRAIGRLLAELDAAELTASTLIVVTADHGGTGVEHGPDHPESFPVPWIVAGPSIRQGVDLDGVTRDPIPVTATFALVSTLLGLEVTHARDGDFPRAILRADDPPPDDRRSSSRRSSGSPAHAPSRF